VNFRFGGRQIVLDLLSRELPWLFAAAATIADAAVVEQERPGAGRERALLVDQAALRSWMVRDRATKLKQQSLT